MNKETEKNGINEDNTPIWNLETYETPISKNNNDPTKKKYLRVILVSVTMFIVFLSVVTVLAIKLQLPRRIALWNPSEETIRQDVSTYLEERYDEKFVITNIIFPNFNYASYIITAYPEGKPQKSDYKITIHGWENKGLIDYYDNYPVVKLIPELREYISDVVGEYFPENKVYVDFYNEWIRENVDKDMTLDDYLNDIEGEWHNAGWYRVCIPHNDQDDEMILKNINEAVFLLSQEKISGICLVDVMYNNYYNLPEYYEGNGLGKNGKDFYSYDYYIARDGSFSEETEVKSSGIK